MVAAPAAALAPSLTISPSRVMHAPAITSSSKSSFSSPSAIISPSSDWMLRAYSCEACSAIVEGTFSGARILTSWRMMLSPGSDSSQLPPVSAARSTITEPGFIRSTASSVTRIGARRPGTAAVVITTSTFPIASAISSC